VPINTYLDALRYFYSYTHYNPADTSNWSLDRMRKLLARLGNPQNRFPSLLIAGTKGKGSTAAISESILRAAGYKTGLYTSPHLHSFRERIRIGGELISEETVIGLAQRLKPYFEDTPDLSAFELITAVAFMAFAEANVDVAVLEVGLGGRLDATNAVDPTVAVITSISYDHTQILGETLTLIAREKAGIIRPGALVISAPQVDEAMAMIESVCQEYNARLVSVDRDWQWNIGPCADLSGQSFTVDGDTYWLSMLGRHQVVNAVTALAAIAGLVERTDLTVSQQAYHQGIGHVKWLGRLEILARNPYVVVDSAMNGDSMEKLVQTLDQCFAGLRKTFIFGASNDHPIEDMLHALLPVADKMYTVASRHPRAEPPEQLAEAGKTIGGNNIQPVDSMEQAVALALAEAGPQDLICVTGSLFLVADAREVWLKRNKLALPPIDPMVVST
jgi:dihydrofolate synthase/folylpolyglutamate synthase